MTDLVHATPLTRLRGLVMAIAIAVGSLIGVSIPAGYFTVSYLDEAKILEFTARLSAARLSQYAYVYGTNWKYNTERLRGAISYFGQDDNHYYQRIGDTRDAELADLGTPPEWPAASRRRPIVTDHQEIGWVEVSTSIRGLVLRTIFVGALGLAIGLSAYFAVYFFPLRALTRALGDLERSQADTRAANLRLIREAAELEESSKAVRQARDQAFAASRAKSDFLARMSHELRTPLNAILGFSEVLKDELIGPMGNARYRDYAGNIHESGQHLLKLVNEVLDLSRIEAGKELLHIDAMEISSVVADCAHIFETMSDQAGVRLDLSAAVATDLVAWGDRIKLKQVLLNLISNAVKFTKPGGAVSVSARLDGESSIVLDVADTGAGMDAQGIAQALEPFGQVGRPDVASPEGTGLGLPIAKKLAELQGGTLTIASVLGKGTVVSVKLLRADAS